MKRLHILGVALFVFATAAIASVSTSANASAPMTQCNYIGAWYNGGGEIGCTPLYACPNTAVWPFSDRCWTHMNTADVPSPCNEQ